MRGRPRKNTEVLKITGTFRPDRHASRGDVSLPPAEPLAMPSMLVGTAAACWDKVVGSMPPGVFHPSDEPLLIAFCDCWAAYLDARGDGDGARQMRIADQLTKIACRLGLTPTDRGRLQIPEAPREAGIRPRDRA